MKRLAAGLARPGINTVVFYCANGRAGGGPLNLGNRDQIALQPAPVIGNQL